MNLNEPSHAELVLESRYLRGNGHRLQGANLELSMRFDDTIKKLESRGDREARGVLMGLAKEAKDLSGVLAARVLRVSAVNRTVVELLQKSQDGKAALMMRKAAELLVKGLANAEEEVHSLKATVLQLEGQRDHYKALLAKTNSELTASHAYAQMSEAIGQAGGGASAASGRAATAFPGGTGADDAGIKRSAAGGSGCDSVKGKGKGKGKAPARQAQQNRSVGAAGAGAGATTPVYRYSGRSGDGSAAAATAAVAAQAAGNGARISVPGRTGSVSGGAPDGTTTTASASKKRRRGAAAPSAGSGDSDGGGGGGDGGDSKLDGEQPDGPIWEDGGGEVRKEGLSRRRKRGEAASSSGTGRGAAKSSAGRENDKQVGVEVSVSVSDVTTGPLASGGDNSDGEEGGGGGGGSEEYDSEDAPSMFF